ncbi:hypothetical protein V0R50_10620 [Pseudomonas sp. 148P]|uniref:Lipoprotein n=1 Tax=Pseudomonas ulcerans TaxID=3115852 RepID=A0ABU7HQ86_9PSED|nr:MULTISPECIES: hypothetical protein [unclassified Pseudomonas]MEE1922697.1 hypothetical protein [Pseudomonas sp. 147P]MEE1933674.1 hypothetical protein [Pseudomonas sp. 148P]
MRAAATATIFLSAALSGCGTTTVSPAIAGNPGVKTATGPNGYPVLASVTFNRSGAATPDARSACIRSQVNDIEGAPVITGSAVQASAKTSFYFAAVGMSKAFRYSLAVQGDSNSTYTFDRMRYINEGSQGGPLMASSYWSPEYVVQELESIADSIDSCARGR